MLTLPYSCFVVKFDAAANSFTGGIATEIGLMTGLGTLDHCRASWLQMLVLTTISFLSSQSNLISPKMTLVVTYHQRLASWQICVSCNVCLSLFYSSTSDTPLLNAGSLILTDADLMGNVPTELSDLSKLGTWLPHTLLLNVWDSLGLTRCFLLFRCIATWCQWSWWFYADCVWNSRESE